MMVLIVKALLIVTVLLQLIADSVFFDKTYISHRFSHWQQYQYVAAYHDNAQANFQISQDTLNTSPLYNKYLQRAALLEHPEANWMMYQQESNFQDKQYWLTKAALLGNTHAQKKMAEQLLVERNWKSLSEHLPSYLKVALNQQQYQRDNKWYEFAQLGLQTKLNGVQPIDPKYRFDRVETGISKHCLMSVLPLAMTVSDEAAQKLLTSLQNSKTLQSLGICFLPIIVAPELYAICEFNTQQRLCDYKKLSSLLKNIKNFSHLLILTDLKKAYVHQGIMYASYATPKSVFIHEVGHWFGLIDEYPIIKSEQDKLCTSNGVTKVGLNLILADKKLTKSAVEQTTNRQLREVDTCFGSETIQAYSVLPTVGFMRHLDLMIGEDDIDFIVKNWQIDSVLSALTLLKKYAVLDDIDVWQNREQQYRHHLFNKRQTEPNELRN